MKQGKLYKVEEVKDIEKGTKFELNKYLKNDYCIWQWQYNYGIM